MRWWEKNPGRLLQEREIMQRAFPHAALTKLKNGLLAWDVTLESNSGNSYRALIVYPEGFPSVHPSTYILEPTIKDRTPHVYADGHLCLFNTYDRPESTYVPGKTTAVTVTVWTAAWIFTYENYKETGRWS